MLMAIEDELTMLKETTKMLKVTLLKLLRITTVILFSSSI